VGASLALTISSDAAPVWANVNGIQKASPVGLAKSPRVDEADAMTCVIE
jgi:hypothetical protein